MKKIEVSKNIFTTVNDNTYEWASQFKWMINKGYVFMSTGKFYKRERRLHRLIMKAQKGQEVDHIDGDPLNNLKSNLRICTRKQNSYSRKLNKDNTSGFKGVVKHNDKWRAQARIDGKLKYFGFYKTKEEAAKAYNEAAKKHFGEFARLNNL